MAEGKNLKRSAGLLSVFLAGRFLGYAGWAIISWFAGRAVAARTGGIPFFGLADVLLGGWLMVYGFSRPIRNHPAVCPAALVENPSEPAIRNQSLSRAGLWGILSGFSLCPPFLAAISEAAQIGSLTGSLFFFLFFYIGTGLWFLPFPLVGLLGRIPQAAQVARFCVLPLGAYYLYRGFVALAGGNF